LKNLGFKILCYLGSIGWSALMEKLSKVFVSLRPISGLVRGEAHWHHFMTKIGITLAYPDRLPERPKSYYFQKSDLVVVRRELMLGTQHIPSGSTGIVTVTRDRDRLFDVMFFCDPSGAITISKFDLLHVA
jgi:hypothetical protein